MKTMQFDEIDQVLYYEKLDNGLEVYLIPQQNRNNCYATYTTKYGSIHNEFIPINQKKYKKFPSGIAHFLEHKMFEQESGIDPFSFYAKSGTEANAATGFLHTSYLFYGSENINENLDYLLNYVSSPYITDESVEKEKGIIEQEIRMYDDSPLWVLQDGLRANVFSVHPVKEAIGGTVKSINAITKDDLYECYNTFYHPSNMVLVVTGNFNEQEIINVIKENQSKKNYDKLTGIKIKPYVEPVKVVKDYEEKNMIVEIPKISMGIKIPLKKLEKYDSKVCNLYLGILGYVLFGKTSLFYERMRDLELIVGSVHLGKLKIDSYLLATITAESNKPKELMEEIKKQLKNIEINSDDFERMKKVLIQNYISLFDDVIATNDKILDNIINYNKIYFNEINIIKSLNLKELRDFIRVLDLSNVSTYIIKPN